MKPTKEIAILRLVIDLIMADNKIHRDEVSWAKIYLCGISTPTKI